MAWRVDNIGVRGWQTILSHLSDLVFPQACLACDRTISSVDGYWCERCAGQIVAEVSVEYCPRCGHSAGPHLGTENGCGECRERLPPFEAIVRIGSYYGIMGELVRKYKLGKQQRMDRCLAGLLSAAIRGKSWCGQIDALVPVPTAWSSRWRYRSNPVGMLTGQMGADLDLPVLPIMKIRGKKRRQMELSLSERPANVRGVFCVDRHARISGTTLCVVDDVSTSGATLREVTRALKLAGAKTVYAAVLAKTDSGPNVLQRSGAHVANQASRDRPISGW